ncbi:hypothetical protein AURDEDRAFT_172336 [Auricularia subglabra TFB-10046 SS5]|nr:hypothetical protein AURDEDRAFT_172336 [Auricularia subglabra TFB-10046 SS5]
MASKQGPDHPKQRMTADREILSQLDQEGVLKYGERRTRSASGEAIPVPAGPSADAAPLPPSTRSADPAAPTLDPPPGLVPSTPRVAQTPAQAATSAAGPAGPPAPDAPAAPHRPPSPTPRRKGLAERLSEAISTPGPHAPSPPAPQEARAEGASPAHSQRRDIPLEDQGRRAASPDSRPSAEGPTTSVQPSTVPVPGPTADEPPPFGMMAGRRRRDPAAVAAESVEPSPFSNLLSTLRNSLVAGVQSFATPRKKPVDSRRPARARAPPSAITKDLFSPETYSPDPRELPTFQLSPPPPVLRARPRPSHATIEDDRDLGSDGYAVSFVTADDELSPQGESPRSEHTIRGASAPPEYVTREYERSDSSEDRLPVNEDIPPEDRDVAWFWADIKDGVYNGWGRPHASNKMGPRRTKTEIIAYPPKFVNTPIYAVTTTTTTKTAKQAIKEAQGAEKKKKKIDKGKERDPRERPADPRPDPVVAPTPGTSTSRVGRAPVPASERTITALDRAATYGRSIPLTPGNMTRQTLAAGHPTVVMGRMPKKTNAPNVPPGGVLAGRMNPDGNREQSRFFATPGKRPSAPDPDPDPNGGGNGNGPGLPVILPAQDPDDPDDADGDEEPEGDPDEGDEDGNGTEPDPDEEDERQRRLINGLKLPMPSYDGTEDLKKFESFVFNWDNWLAPKRLTRERQVALMAQALTGEANEWFMTHVALDEYPWTVREIYQELYETCFSDDFREELRAKLMKAKQKGRPVKDFAKEIRNLAVRYPDIDEYALRRIFWNGADAYIQLFWTEKVLAMAATFPSFLRAVNGEPQFDYTRASDDRIARHLKVELLNYFPPESALRFRLQDPADRFTVAYPGLSMGLFVKHTQFKIVDDVRNCVYVVDRSLITYRGVNIENVIHAFLGLSQDDLYETLQLCTRNLPWFANSTPVMGALTYVNGLWVPVINHIHARELGFPRLQRWALQTDAVDLWVRDIATNVTYEVSVTQLARGIRIRDLLKQPEFLNKPGAIIKSHTAARDWELGEDWTVTRSPSISLDLEITTHRYWVWRNQFAPPPDPTQPPNPIDALDDAILALLSLGQLGRVVESAQETHLGEDSESESDKAGSEAEPAVRVARDSPPGLLAVSDSSESGGGEDDVQSLPSSSDDGGHVSAPAEPGSAWQEYLFSAHGARWLRNHARPRRGASPAQFYDYESDGTHSA